MIVRINKTRSDFFSAPRKPFIGGGLLLESRGLLGFFLAQPDDYQIDIRELIKILPASKLTLQKCFQDLQRNGYAVLSVRVLPNGRKAGKEWTIIESPDGEMSTSVHRQSQNQVVGEQDIDSLYPILGTNFATDDSKNRLSVKPTIGKTDDRENASLFNYNYNNYNNYNYNVDGKNFSEKGDTSVAPTSPFPPNSAPPPLAPRGAKTFSEWGVSREEFCRLLSQYESAITEDAACTLYDRLGKWKGGAATSTNWVKTAVTIWRDDEKKKEQGQQKQIQYQQKVSKLTAPDFTNQDRYKSAKNG